MTNTIIPAGRFSVRTTDSKAPSSYDLLGRPDIPAIASAASRISATVKGFINDPLSPLEGRDQLLAKWERGIDVNVEGGARLRALDAASGKFHVHLTPASVDDGSSLHVALAPQGDEKNAVVQDHPHAPSAPVGFYNLDSATAALSTIDRVLTAAVKEPTTLNVNRLRAESILARLDTTQSYLETLRADQVKHPILASLKDIAHYAYKTKKYGDEKDQQFKQAVSALKTYVAEHPQMRNELKEQIKEEISNLTADQKKWVDWRASTGIQTFYVNMG